MLAACLEAQLQAEGIILVMRDGRVVLQPVRWLASFLGALIVEADMVDGQQQLQNGVVTRALAACALGELRAQSVQEPLYFLISMDLAVRLDTNSVVLPAAFRRFNFDSRDDRSLLQLSQDDCPVVIGRRFQCAELTDSLPPGLFGMLLVKLFKQANDEYLMVELQSQRANTIVGELRLPDAAGYGGWVKFQIRERQSKSKNSFSDLSYTAFDVVVGGKSVDCVQHGMSLISHLIAVCWLPFGGVPLTKYAICTDCRRHDSTARECSNAVEITTKSVYIESFAGGDHLFVAVNDPFDCAVNQAPVRLRDDSCIKSTMSNDMSRYIISSDDWISLRLQIVAVSSQHQHKPTHKLTVVESPIDTTIKQRRCTVTRKEIPVDQLIHGEKAKYVF